MQRACVSEKHPLPLRLWSSFCKQKKFEAFTKILISYVVNIRERWKQVEEWFHLGWAG